MQGFFRSAALAALFILGSGALAVAAPTTVTVGLVDSSIMGQGGGPGGNGYGTMGQGRGFGMMGGGMMGGRGGFGRGAMGQGMMAIRTDRTTVEAGAVTFERQQLVAYPGPRDACGRRRQSRR